MPDLLVQSFAPLLLAFQPCFTQPSFRSFCGLVCAWILCCGRRCRRRRKTGPLWRQQVDRRGGYAL